MDRTDRLFALVDELWAAAPPLAIAGDRRHPTGRAVERDLSALQRAGVPVYATSGRRDGNGPDGGSTLPPVDFTAREATALAVALARSASTPFASAGRAALHKVLAAMTVDDAVAARRLSARVRLYHSAADPPAHCGPDVAPALDEAIADRVVVRIDYQDKQGAWSSRAVEPLAAVEADSHWYLWAWCRLREDDRLFRMDRIRRLVVTEEPAPERGLDLSELDLQALVGRASRE